MAWIPLLLPFFTLFTGSLASYVLKQPPSVSETMGKPATLTCEGDLLDKKYAYWFQQKWGETPRLIIYEDTKRPQEVSDRFSGSSSNKVASLTISEVRAEDEADYYCLSFDENSNPTVIAIAEEVRHKPL